MGRAAAGYVIHHVMLWVHGADKQVAQKTYDEQNGHNMHRRLIRSRTCDAMRDLIGTDVVDERRTSDTGHGPGCQQAPVYSSHVRSTENIGKIRRNRRETTAVERQDNAVCEHEQDDVASRRKA